MRNASAAKTRSAIATTKTTTIKWLAALALLCACSAPPSTAQTQTVPNSLFAAAPEQQWRLPDRLREISGLALSPDGRVFGHDDEHAVIYEIDVTRGALVKAFALGDPVEAGDFEGLAITPSGEFWLTTSRGELYRFREGSDGEHVAFAREDSGAPRACEVEGLAYVADSLILACKRHDGRDMRRTVALYQWRFGGEAQIWRTWPEDAFTAAAGGQHFRPSSLDVDQASGRLLLLSAFDAALAEIASDGEIMAVRALGRTHVQAEGVVAAADGALIIADEGAGGRALLSRYARNP